MNDSRSMKDDILVLSSRTGLSSMNIEKEWRLFEFIPVLFNKLEERGIKAVLYGGTALNKGYFGERQRFSKDIDIYLSSRNFKNTCLTIERLLIGIGRYEVERIHLNNESAAWSIKYGKGKTDDILIEARKSPCRLKPVKIELHSILEYSGASVMSILVPSLPLEWLLAGKIIALSRRAIGKDIYDVEMGLKLKPKKNEIKKIIRLITKQGPDKIIKNAIYWIEQIDVSKQHDIIELQDSIPIAYRRDIKVVLSSLKYELNELLRD